VDGIHSPKLASPPRIKILLSTLVPLGTETGRLGSHRGAHRAIVQMPLPIGPFTPASPSPPRPMSSAASQPFCRAATLLTPNLRPESASQVTCSPKPTMATGSSGCTSVRFRGLKLRQSCEATGDRFFARGPTPGAQRGDRRHRKATAPLCAISTKGLLGGLAIGRVAVKIARGPRVACRMASRASAAV